MNKLSTKMKRMLAVLLVEAIIATNVITSYASSADEPFTMTEQEAASAQMQEEAEEPTEEVVAVVEEDPVIEEPAVEEPVVEEPVVEEPAEAPVEEIPAEAPVEDAAGEMPAEEAPEEEMPAAEVPVEEEAEAASETPAAEEAAEGEETEVEAEETEVPAEEETEEVLTTEIDNSVVITGICEADGGVIAGTDSFVIAVDGVVTLEQMAPSVAGYVFADEVSLEDGTPVTQVKKEVSEEETQEGIIRTTSMSYTDGADWVELTEDVTVVFTYTMEDDAKEETVTEETEAVAFVASYVDTQGNAIEGFAEEPLSFEESIDLTQTLTTIENYTYIEARINGTVAAALHKTTDEEGVVTYTYTAANEEVEVTEDTTVVFVYAPIVKEVVITAECIDEEGKAILGYEEVQLPSFEEELVLDNPESAPYVIADYTYAKAKMDGVEIASLIKAVDEETGIAGYSYVTADGETVAVEEDTVLTLCYETEEVTAKVTVSVVDSFGDAIDAKYTNLALDELFGKKEVLVLDDAENPPVAKVQIRQSLFKVIKYTYVDATIHNEVITGLKRTATKKTADLDEKEYVYSYTTDGKTYTAIKEDATVLLKYSDGKKSVYTYEDNSVQVTATLQHANAIPDDAQFVVTPITQNSSDYNYDAYMEALNQNAGKLGASAADKKTDEPQYTEENTLLYDIAFLAPALDAEGNAIEGELVEYQPAEGMVNIVINFKRKQLENTLDATSAEKVSVIHMPLVDEVKNSVNTTADATDISADDIKVEVVDSNVALENEKIDFNLSDFSVTVVTSQAADEDLIIIKKIEGVLSADELTEEQKQRITFTLMGNGQKVKEFDYTEMQDGRMGLSGLNDGYYTLSESGVIPGYKVTTTYKVDGVATNNLGANVSQWSVPVIEVINTYDKLDTFESNGGEYTLEYILNNFQIVALDGDVELVNHCMGAILINGDQLGNMVGFADDVNTAKNVSSYIKGVYNGAVAGRADASDIPELAPLYVGSVNEVEEQNGQWKINGTYNSQMKTSAVYLSDDYVNWEMLGAALRNQSASISNGCTDTVSAADATNGVLNIQAGECVTINDLSGISCINIIGNMTDAINTVINIPATGDVTLPDVKVNGSYATVAEVASGTAVVWNLPNAAGTVTMPSINWVGHVIAPNAHVHVSGGNYNGGIICKSMYSRGEGHVYPYNGGTIIPTTSGFSAKKTVDGQTPSADEVFTFKFDELVNGSWNNRATVTNSGSAISFPSISYSDASDIGEHWYIVYEEQKTQEGYSLSTILYVVKDVVSSVTRSNIETYSAASTYYRVNGSENGWMDPASIISGSSVDMSKLQQISGEDSVVFDNSTAKTEISVSKEWNDNNNQDGIRPASVTVQLKSNGQNYGSAVVLNADNNWSYTWTGLPEKFNGSAVNYSVEEVEVPDGYEVSLSGDANNGFVLTNTHTTQTISIHGNKTWNDADNQDGMRPLEITVKLLANGEEVQNATVKPDADGNWNFTFSNLPAYVNGNKITYTLAEVAVEGYTTKISGNAESGFAIVNTHEVEKISVNGIKTWADNDNRDGVRPSDITIRLLADGVEVAEKVVTAADKWAWDFTNLPKYKNVDGKAVAIKYTVTEDAVAGYTTTVDGYNVTNTHEEETTSVSGSKTWADNNNRDGKRPSAITVNLLADGVEVAEKVVTANDNWTWNFTNLPKYKEGSVGVEIVYTVTEDAVAEYTSEVNGYDVTNTHEEETTSVSGSKTWADKNNQDGKRPSGITIHLLADGEEVAEKVVTAEDNWAWSFTELPKYQEGKEGVEIVYTITEDKVAEYTTEVNGFDITNSYTTETTQVSGSKTWKDGENRDGKRPSGITITLMANGEEKESVTVTEKENWSWSFENLDKYANGKEIVYTIVEATVEGYTTTYDGYNVINDYTPEETGMTVVKKWEDQNDQDGIRPDSVSVQLYAEANGVKDAYGAAVQLSDANNWTYTWTGLPKNDDGKEIIYTVEEVGEVTGYTTADTTYEGSNATITNTHETETTEVSGSKTWADNDNQDGIRPEKIVIHLHADGEIIDTVTVTAKENWSWSFTDLPKNKNTDGESSEIKYTITEDAVEGYTTEVNGYDVTNTHTTEKVSVEGSKTWADNNNQDGIRPSEIKVTLLADGVSTGKSVIVTAEDNWSFSFSGLDKFKAGKEIVYSVTEEAVDGYTMTVNGYDITNTHVTEKIVVDGTKTWDDADNQDGKRPESITVHLHANGEKIASKTVTAQTGWSYSFANLDKYANGQEIVYTITEDAVEGYTTTVTGYDVVNTHVVEKIDIQGTKIWNDNQNQDGLRPAQIVVKLLADGKEIDSAIVTGDAIDENGNWTWNFTNLPKYKDGVAIEYTVTEATVAGYNPSVSGSMTDGFTITNSHTPGETGISVKKIWNDADDQDGIRPGSIQVQLFAEVDGVKEPYGDAVTLSESNNWSANWEKLPEKENGKEILYTVEEVDSTIPEGYFVSYSLEADGKMVTITNTHTTEKISISGSKTWADADNQDGLRPQSITIQLYAGETLKDSKTVTSADNWSWTFDNLDKYAAGAEIKYSIKEVAVEGYTTTYDGYNVTNTHEVEKTQISGSKTWVDNENQDGLRPAAITVNLLKDGTKIASETVTEEDGWSWSFTDLDKYRDNGTLINYTITEDKVTEYTTEVSGFNIVNTHTPGKTSYSVEKIWDDAENQDGMRAASVRVQLLADGEAVADGSVVLSDANNWKHTWTNLDEKKNGVLIQYSVKEIEGTEGYSVSYKETDNGMLITNTHTTEKVSVSGSKTWEDNNNQDGVRPDSITITLLADGEIVAAKTVTAENWSWSFTDLPKYADGKEIVYTITESEVPGYTTQINGFDVVNTHEVEKTQVSGSKLWNDADNQDGVRPESVTINLLADNVKVDSQVVTADASGNWSYVFKDLDKYADGKEIQYSVTEETIKTADYSATIDGFIITNNYTPDETAHTVTKIWEDNENQDGIRPDEIRVQLFADGKEEGQPVTLTAAGAWTYTWNHLTKYRDGGVEIKYTVQELDEVSGYTIGEPATANGKTTITNTHTTEKVSVSGSKTWADNDNQDGVRPVSITIHLLADGVATGKSLTVTAEDGWVWEFTNLEKYKDGGKEIVYTITEDAVEGYTSEVNGYNVTNTHEAEKTQISGSKVWDDANNQDGKRPASITVNLLADNAATGKSIVVTPDDKGEWSYSFTDLPKYKDGGKLIVYSVTEDTVEDYTTTVDGYVIKNSYTPGKTNHVVTKVWNDADNQDGKRPSTIQVQLLADGNPEGEPVVLDATNNWVYTWENLDLMREGKEIAYTVEEVSVPEGYTLTSNVTEGIYTTITNSYDTEEISVSGAKTWADNNNQDGMRPASISISLYADGVLKETKTVTEADGWAWSFTGLPKYAAGKEIVYTIAEAAVANYETTVNGFNVLNTHETEKTQVSGSKTWNDADNQDGVRPESIVVHLHANGEIVASKTVTEADNWSWSFADLDKYANGNEIAYTVSEEKIATADYQAVINGFDITNNYTAGKTSLNVTKLWVDGENQDGLRPDAVTVQLYADDKAVEGKTVQLNAANGWSASFTDLDEKKDGKIIAYTAKEETIAGYIVSYTNTANAAAITNTHIPEEISVSGSKTWEDNNNQDGKRPASITVNLLANGNKVASQVVSPDKDGNWSYTFTNLPKKENGIDIEYTVTEEAVSGYTTTVNGTSLVNTHDPEKVNVSGQKTWVGDEAHPEARPESITIRLFADNKEIDAKTVTEADNWSWSFTDLDKYADGKEILYTITEDFVNGYSTDVKGYDVINNYTPGYTSIEVTKIWDDNNNQDGVRPQSITVQLYEKYLDWGLIEISGPKGDPIVLNEDNNWTNKWTNLPVKKQSSDEVQYFVKEIGTIAGYETEIINGTDIKITNTYETETTKVEGKKIWKDNNNQDGVRPQSITVRLFDGEMEVDAKTVTEADNWKWSFTDLPKYKNGGTLIVYTVKEDVVLGYESVIDGYDVTNTHIPEQTEYPVEKIWEDANDQDGLRPDAITVQLYANDVAVEGKTVVLNSENAWKATFTDLDKYADGKAITYSAQEAATPDGYIKNEVVTEEGTTITNTHTPATVEVKGSKTWNDADNQDGLRPEKIVIRLFANGIEAGMKEVTEQDSWSWSFTNLPKYEAGVEIVYTVKEDKVEGYTAAVSGFDVENTHEVQKTALSGSKVWDDADDQDGLRPESITVNLHANGEKVASKTITADEQGNWSWSFTNLDKYKAGVEIKYTVSEDVVSKYSSVVEGTQITNSYTPGKTSLNVSKIWTDNENQDGLRPDGIMVDLYADGKKVEGKSIELNEANGWAYTWTNLDEKQNGQVIVYTAVEADEVEGYTTAYNNETAGTTIITNTHETETTKVSGSKTWEDNDDQDGKRPESITIRLLADGSEVKSQIVTPDEQGNWSWSFTELPKYRDGGVEIVYTITEDEVAEYKTQISGYDVINTHEIEKVSLSGSKTWSDNEDAENVRPESITVRLYADSVEVDHVTITPDEKGDWSWSFTDLDKYANGQEINYTVSEDKVIDYKSAVSGYNINNTYDPGTTQISVSKVWLDNENQDGIRPESITVKLMEKTTFFDKVRDEVTLNANNNWSYTWSNLPDEKKSEKVQYYVKEVKVDGYTTEINNGTTNITITNTHETETTQVNGSKTWEDNNNQDGKRPESITIRLLADGSEVKNQIVTPDKKGNWEWSFTELPKYRDGGVEIVYTITEDAVEEYTTEIKGTAADGYEVINTDEIDKTNYKVEKKWEDANNQDGVRPESITVQLYADGTALEGKTVVLNSANAWKGTFEDLDKYADGKVIVYTAQEVAVPEGYTMTADHTAEGLTVITNSHTPDVISVAGGKTWNDAENQDGVRPASITVNLLANGIEVAEKVVTAADNWTWNFNNLPKYENGKEIIYTITEDAVAEYTAVVDGYNVTNNHDPETVEVSGSKTWADSDDQDGKRPVEITITLNADGQPAEQAVVSESDNWTWTFTDLPKYKDGGKEIVYTVSEAAVEEYTTTYDGYNVINSYTPGETGVTVTKAWDDANDQDGIRPASIQVQLAADGTAYGDPVALSADNNWTYTWTKLPEMKQGKKIAYTVEEIMGSNSGYTSITTGDAANGYTITNTHDPETVEVAGSKTWIDADNQDGKRPVSITINLLADGELKESKNVTAADGWSWRFTDLPKYKDGGKEIVYTITENEVADYATEINGYDAENTHIPETVEVAGSKTWNDNENAEGVRPEKIIINLLADGKLIESKTVTEADDWKWSFTNLDKYKDGVEIVYTITEDEVVDYSTTVTGYDVTNDYTPEETKITVTKVWDDADNQDGIRPLSIKVQLYEGVFVRGDAVELNAENNWTYSWEHLPAKKFGIPVEYTVKEVDTIHGYTTEIIDGTSTTITNKHIPEVTEVKGSKTWDDADDQDGLRPESITIKLYADGELKDTKTVTEADGWKWAFTDLPKNKNVNGEVTEIVYTIEEVAVDGYKTVMKDGSYDITNVHKPEEIDIEGTKTWNDADNQDGKRPVSITIRLYANGTEVDYKTVTAANNWKWTFTDLPKYDKGAAITYTITEDVVTDYSTTYDGNNVINSYTPEKTSRTVVKVWDDQGNRDNLRPSSVVVQLYADGSAKGEPVILSEANGWTYTWANLDVKKEGKEIVYSVIEITRIAEYTTTYSENTFTITNRYVPKESTPTPTPDTTPTPGTPTPTPNTSTPTPTPENSVLGAKRVDDGTVLGARRGSDYAVLGKRRRPATGDSLEIFVWLMALATSMGGALTSIVMMNNNKKKRK